MIRQRNGKYQVRVEYAATFAALEDARARERAVRSALAAAHDARIEMSACPTIREILPDFLLSRKVEHGCRADTIRDYRRRLERFADDLSDGAGDVPLDRIGRRRLLLWIDRRLGEPGYQGSTVARATVKKELAALQTFANYAVRHKAAPPGLPLFSVRLAGETSRKDGAAAPHVTLAEFVSIVRRIESRSPHAALILWAMVAFGVRPRAALELKWRQVRRPRRSEPGVARFKTLKKGEPAVVPVPPGSLRLAVLDEAAALHERYFPSPKKLSHAVFPTRRGRSRANPRGWTPSSFAHEIRRLADKLRLHERFTAYVTRHSGVTWLKQQGVDASAVRHWAKHRSEQTQAVYDHTSGEDARPAYEAIDSLLLSEFYRPGRAASADALPALREIALYDE